MTTGESALLMVMPGEDIGMLAERVAATPTNTIDIMVPDGIAMLHDTQAWQQLHATARQQGSQLVAITGDAATIAAAQRAGVRIMGIQGSAIAAPPTLPPATAPRRATSSDELSPVLLAALQQPIAPPLVPARPTPPPAPVAPPANAVSAADMDLMAELDSLADMDAMGVDPDAAAAPTIRTNSSDDALAAQLDDLDMAYEQQTRSVPAPPPRRIRPEDIELSHEEVQRARTTGKRTAAPSPRKPRRRDDGPTLEELHARAERERNAQRRRKQPRVDVQPETASETRERNPLLMGLLLALLLGALLFLLFTLFGDRLLGNRVSIQVTLPVPPTEAQPIGEVPIFITQPGSEDSGLAVFAVPIRSTIAFTTTGQVNDETLTPSGSAQGTVTIFSQNNEPISFPPGTELNARNPQGNEVRFVNDTGFTVPAATTERVGAQIITTLGEASVNVLARNPGSSGNVEANTIFQIIAPGQAPIAVNSGGLLDVTHGPLTGGSEAPVRIVKDADVEATLSAALTGLYNAARQTLNTQAQAAGLALEATTVVPTAEQLSQRSGYQVQVLPPIGQPVDLANPVFQVIVTGEFNGLATPLGQPLPDQLQRVLTNQLASEGRIPWGMAPAITDWRWDGSRLMVSAVLQPVPTNPELNEEQRREIRNALRGKTRAEAEGILQEYVRRNWIGSYVLPANVEVLPSRDTQIDLVVEPQPTLP